MADNKLYKILGVSRNASEAEIRKQYKRLAKEFHPDKNPHAGDKFKEISFAYEVLSDPKQRHIYDHYGLKGLQRDSRHHREPSFSDIFESGFLFNAFRRHPRGNDLNILLSVSLEELYNGTVRKMEHERVVVCSTCFGKGCKNGVTLPKCYTCHGTGLTTHARTSSFFGFGFMEHIPTQCPKCGGTGEVITERLKCPTCLGKKIREEKKMLDVFVEKGMHNNQKIHFRGEGNQMPGEIPGDVTVILQEQNHEKFQRSGDNLKFTHTITLTEALCGFEFALRHLDGRDIIVRNLPGEVVKPGDVKYVMGEGMPIYRNATERGNLIITFDVVFPPNHFQTPNILAQLEALLPARPLIQIPTGENVEEVDLEEYDPNNDRGNGYQRYGEAYHSDDEDAHDHNAGIRCATQ